MDKVSFDRTKIYEELEYAPEPPGYTGKIPWVVQQQIAATNGKHFTYNVGGLEEYPIPEIPIRKAIGDQLLLDIGNGWGRWLVAAGRKGYIPIGIDLRIQFCETTLKVLKENNVAGYAVVADLRQIPFKKNIFDAVWSFSVIQHTHYERLVSCVYDIWRILKNNGFCYLEFPNRNGIRNRFGPVQRSLKTANDYNSWAVRYYTPEEYRKIFLCHFDNFSYFVHSFLGIGVLSGDEKYVKGIKSQLGTRLSLMLSSVAKAISPLKSVSDSIYIQCVKHENLPDDDMDVVRKFISDHKENLGNNLNIVKLLKCPVSDGELIPAENGKELISPKAGLAYPVINGIPIMIQSEARSM